MIARGIRDGVRRLFRLPLRTEQRIHDDVDAELQSYIDARMEHLVARGMSPVEARAEALRRLGGTIDELRERLHQSAEHRERRVHLRERIDDLLNDVRYAARGLARRPGFTVTAVLTLAIGIGATTAIFSAINALILRPLPYARPDELMKVSLTNRERDDIVWSYPKFVALRDAQRAFRSMSLYASSQFTITSGEVEQVRGETVGATYLRTLGLGPQRGSDFDPSIDAHPGAPRLAVISDALWQRRYNADPGVIGTTIDIDRNPFVIIGVAPADFRGLTGTAELFIPITTRSADALGQPSSHEYSLVARRRPEVTADAAASEVAAIGTRVAAQFVNPGLGCDFCAVKAVALDAARVGPVIRRSLFILFSAVICVLLIACVNVANLQLSRASGRAREIAVRLALGARRTRVVRLLLTESLLLAIIGWAAGLFVAWAGTHALSKVNPAAMFRGLRTGGLGSIGFSLIHLDTTTFLFALVIAVVVGLVFGLAPALHATRATVADTLKGGAGEYKHSRFGRAFKGRRLLVVTEVALALVLLAASGLLLRSLGKLLATDPGFDARNVLTVRLTVPPGGPPQDSLPVFYTQLLARLSALPGVSSVSLSNCAPLTGPCNGTRLTLLDRPQVPNAEQLAVGVFWTSPEWFTTMRVPLKRGRLLAESDRIGTPKVVIINEAAARRFWPGEDPVGRRVGVGQGGFGDGAEVVGIVGDVRRLADSLPTPEVFISYNQSPRSGMLIFLRTDGNPSALGPTVRAALREVAPRYPVYDLQPMTQRAAAATAQARFSAVLLALFAAVAVVLAVIGIYGVMSLSVAQRTREFGIRMALGADSGRVRRIVFAEGGSLVAFGALVGLAVALAGTRVLRSMLFDVTTSDPVTYVSIVIVLGAAAAVASWIPARRATRVNPTEALRDA